MRIFCCVLAIGVTASGCDDGVTKQSDRSERQAQVRNAGDRFAQSNNPSPQCLQRWRDLSVQGCEAQVGAYFEGDETAKNEWQAKAVELDAECAPPSGMTSLAGMASKNVIGILEGNNPHGTSPEWCASLVDRMGVSSRLLPNNWPVAQTPVDEEARRLRESELAARQAKMSEDAVERAAKQSERAEIEDFQNMLLGEAGLWLCKGTSVDQRGPERGASMTLHVEQGSIKADTIAGLYSATNATGPGTFVITMERVKSGGPAPVMFALWPKDVKREGSSWTFSSGGFQAAYNFTCSKR